VHPGGHPGPGRVQFVVPGGFLVVVVVLVVVLVVVIIVIVILVQRGRPLLPAAQPGDTHPQQ
jgi:preprotein translocase subunit SecY